MISLLLVIAAIALMSGVDAAKVALAFAFVKSRIDARKAAAAALLLGAILALNVQGPSEPTPEPHAGPLSLRGLFVGPNASSDAAIVGALCSELADEIQYDGMQSDPLLKTGVAIDELRKRSRMLRCRGESIGDRQPAARDAIASFFEQQVGTDGGPLTPDQRAAWVTAFREAGRAATDAAK